MNCADIRAHLAAFVYGDLPATEAAAVERHLADCPSCRTERSQLERMRRALDAVPAPSVQVDTNTLYERLARRQAAGARRWRRAALAIAAVAAAVLIAVTALRLDVRVHKDELVIRWGETGAIDAPAVQRLVDHVPQDTRALAGLRDEVHTLAELVQAIATDVDTRDRSRQRDVAALQARIESMQQELARTQSATERDVAALYAAHFPLNSSRKGTTP